MKPDVIQKHIPNTDTIKEIIDFSYQYDFWFVFILRSASITDNAFG